LYMIKQKIRLWIVFGLSDYFKHEKTFLWYNTL